MSSSNNQPPTTSHSDIPSQTAAAPHLDPNAQLGNNGYAPNDNQLAGLVEAATAAADQDVSSNGLPLPQLQQLPVQLVITTSWTDMALTCTLMTTGLETGSFRRRISELA